MATLVLTVVGGIFGGPIGAALGGLAGQAIDRNVLFKPKGREGPRLTDLSLQSSSYGTPIPRIYGTMRVAGSVIWSTDLIESKTKSSSGKGQPSVTNYSYSASFAVILSARAVDRVGRIWADGKLLRGAAGDFKTQTDFRFHQGSEDQAADPLIAAAEGAGMTPAHRGSAYAVFENFQLADYGNRIPSLTFELIADAAPVPIGAIAADVSGGIVRGDDAAPVLTGFSAYGDSARAVLDVLATISGGWFAADGAVIALRHDAAAVRAIGDDGVVATSGKARRGTRRTRSIAAIETVAKRLSVAHYDPSRDYQTSIQQALRPGAGTRAERIDLPAAMAGDTAKGIAQTVLARAEVQRDKRSVTLGWGMIDLVPGDVVSLHDAPGRWRIDTWSLEAMVLTLDLVPLAPVSIAAATASSGRVLGSPDLVHGPTTLAVFEIPSLDDTLLAMPRLMVAAAGSQPGWRQAALLLSTDTGARYDGLGATAAPATMGVLATVPAAATAMLVDRITVLDVDLLHAGMTLNDADNAALDAGANLALVGDELLQFGSAVPLSPTRWRLSRLWRGRRGTESAIGTQALGDRFVLIATDNLVAAEVSLATLGGTATVLASGVGDRPGPARADVAVTGASIRPPSPVQLRAERLSGGGFSLRWARRSRLGWRWIDAVDVPLGEEREAYRVTIVSGSGVTTTVMADHPVVDVASAVLAGGATVMVRQLGTAGESLPATLEIGG